MIKSTIIGHRAVMMGALLLFLTMRASAEVSLPAVFSDHMVLQRDSIAPIWGIAAAGEKVTVRLDRQTRRAVAGADGRWMAKLKLKQAGGPFTLTIQGTNTLTVNDVMVGEVWLCAGQSNMAKAVQEAADWEAEAARADYPQIRMLTVDPLATSVPADNVLGQWQVCTPQVAEDFSATAYYFARELHRALKVPIGILQASWGGSQVEAWLPPASLTGHPELHLQLDTALPRVDFTRAVALQQEQMHNLMTWGPRGPARWGITQSWEKPEFHDAEWPTMDLPVIWDRITPSLGDVGGAWFRREVTIPAAWQGRELMLKLGRIAFMDTTYWNGVPVGHLGFDNRLVVSCGDSRRRYRVPGALVQAGRNVIAVHVINPGYWGSYGGITEPPLSLGPVDAPQEAIPLSGPWRYQVEFRRTERELMSTTATPPGTIPGYAVASLYHGMLAPLIPYGIKGVAWYQGESNSERPYQYRALLPVMIEGWRAAWGQGDFPFLIVQLPGFRPRQPEPGESNWALLRESQWQTVAAVPNCGIVPTIDIGDAEDIHPKNKQEVGRRLALAAQAVAYHQTVQAGGPRFQKMTVEEGAIRLAFSPPTGGLVARDGPLQGFAIAGEDRHFVWAQARIEGDTVVVSHPQVLHPVAVRYAWADNPPGNLFNQAGLPAFPFRTDNWRSRPVFREVVANRSNVKQLRVSFADVGEEGFVKELAPTGFLVAGADRVFHPAKTGFLGNDVLVFSDAEPDPVAVRYAWPGSAAAGQGNLRTVSGMEVLPFRSDDWPDATYAGQ